jgi:capsular exopolysaccharide synthesis family protein
MEHAPGAGEASPDWLSPRSQSEGLVRYVSTVLERRWMVVVVTAVTVLVALVYVAVAPKRYECEADLLVTPVAAGDQTTAGLGLITASNDPTQDISTAARLIDTASVAKLVSERLHLPGPKDAVLDDVTVEPVAQSTLVAVRANRSSAEDAARVANAFAKAAVDQRTAELHATIAQQLPSLRARLPFNRDALTPRVTALATLAEAPDPTIKMATAATPPGSPSSPKPKLALAAGLLGGLILGIGAAFASQALDPRLRREEQIRELFRLPLLARVPRLGRGQDGKAITPDQLPASAIEAFRTLRATLSAWSGGRVRSVLLTSSMAGEGKTTTALSFARVLADAGNTVILIEGDVRRPSIANYLSVRPMTGIGAVLLGGVDLQDALFTTEEYGPNLSFLLAERASHGLSDRLALPAAQEIISEAERMADYVVVDSPPLTEVVDALPMAQHVDAVVIVTRVGVSRLHRLRDLGDMLAHGGVTPAGIVVMGAERVPDSPYYVEQQHHRLPRVRVRG